MVEAKHDSITYIRSGGLSPRDPKEFVREYENREWKLVRWKKRPGLFDRLAETIESYHGQKYDKKSKTLIKDLWDHDHCEICDAIISEYRSDDFSRAWTIDETIWLCPRCYTEIFIKSRKD